MTMCVDKHACLLGDIKDDAMVLNPYSMIVCDELERTADIRDNIGVDQYVVMPNHVHMVVVIEKAKRSVNRATQRVAPTTLMSGSLGAVVGQLKSSMAKRINVMRGTPGQNVWQRSYYDHVIRNDEDLTRISEYIENNPMQWAMDDENPDRKVLRRGDPLGRPNEHGSP